MTGLPRGLIPAFVNPLAGNAEQARDALRAAGGFDIQEVPPRKLADHVRRAVNEGYSRILVAGGDGSIGTAAGVLSGTGIELAILPGGTLNHLARDLSIPLEPELAVRVAMEGHAISVDSAAMNDRTFVNTSSVGAYAAFVRARERFERRVGYHLASLIAGARMLVHMPVFRLAVEVEGVSREYLTPLVFVGVGERELKLPTLGARVPGGRPGLHVMVIRRRSGARTLALALAAMARGTRAVSGTPALDAFLVDSFRIERRARVAAIDGELVRVVPPLEYRHVPGALRIVVGRD